VTIKSLSPKPGTTIPLMGTEGALSWSRQGNDIKVSLPPALPGEYAYVLKIAGPVSRLARVLRKVVSIRG